jgi:hypothetical protein
MTKSEPFRFEFFYEISVLGASVTDHAGLLAPLFEV